MYSVETMRSVINRAHVFWFFEVLCYDNNVFSSEFCRKNNWIAEKRHMKNSFIFSMTQYENGLIAHFEC